MSNIKNCTRCGKMFNYVAGDVICDVCKKEIEEKFQEVKKYIEEKQAKFINAILDEVL